MPSIFRGLMLGTGIASIGIHLVIPLDVALASVYDEAADASELEISPAANEYYLKDELITWLSSNSQTTNSEIKKSLKLNRNLEQKKCKEPIKFVFTTSTKRMIKAECTNSWRRYIKKPSWVNVKLSPSEEIKLQSKKTVDGFILRRDIKKDEAILLDDLIPKNISIELAEGFLTEHQTALPIIAVRKLLSGAPVLLKDVVIGEVVLIAKTTIPSGSSLTTDVISLDTRYFNIPDDALTQAEGWEFMELNRNIIAGEILRKRHLRKAKLVRRNDPITIIIRNSSLEIITSGISVQDGYYGQRIKVINLESGRSVLGTVIGRGEVEVKNN